MALTPWRCGRALLWNVNCPDTSTPSCVSLAAIGAGNVAIEADHHKRFKYSQLEPSNFFLILLAIKTSRVLSSGTMAFLRDLERKQQQRIIW